MKIEVVSFKEPFKAFDILNRLKSRFKQYAIIQPVPPRTDETAVAEITEEKPLSLVQMCVLQKQSAVASPEAFERLREAIQTYRKEMSELRDEYCKVQGVIKWIKKYSTITDSFVAGLEEAACENENPLLEKYIENEFKNTANAVAEYIRAADGERDVHNRNAFYRAIGIINSVLAAAGIYSPGADGEMVDAQFYRVFSLTENSDESLRGRISQYYRLAYVSSLGKILSTGEVSIYE